jgi:prevent-host-death family protein
MTRTISATDARVRFGKLLRDVAEKGETVVVERSGRPQVVVLPVSEYSRLQKLEEPGDRWQRLLDSAIERVDRELQGKELPAADRLIRAMRKERDERLLDLR